MMRLYLDRVIADIEIINIVENALRKDVDTFLDMKPLTLFYLGGGQECPILRFFLNISKTTY